MPPNQDLDFLILGAGWLYQFLHPLLTSRSLSHAATTTTGRNSTIEFTFTPSPSTPDLPLYQSLPRAKTVLITFPIKGSPALKHLVDSYDSTHPQNATQWILLGSTGIYPTPAPGEPFQWFDEHSDATPNNERYIAEETLLKEYHGCVLNLAGLYGEPVRDGKIWERAVPKTKEEWRGKKSVHFVHGRDVARVILRVAERGRWASDRWVVCDGRVYCWWEIVWDAAEKLQGRLEGEEAKGGGGSGGSIKDKEDGRERVGEGELTYRKWILELMEEEGVRALPRPVEMLGRGLDGRSVWRSLGIVPMEAKFAWPKEA